MTSLRLKKVLDLRPKCEQALRARRPAGWRRPLLLLCHSLPVREVCLASEADIFLAARLERGRLCLPLSPHTPSVWSGHRLLESTALINQSNAF